MVRECPLRSSPWRVDVSPFFNASVFGSPYTKSCIPLNLQTQSLCGGSQPGRVDAQPSHRLFFRTCCEPYDLPANGCEDLEHCSSTCRSSMPAHVLIAVDQ